MIGVKRNKIQKKTHSYFIIMVDRCNNSTNLTECSNETEIDNWTEGKKLRLRAINIYQDLDPHMPHHLNGDIEP
jgi:hypothetical protein